MSLTRQELHDLASAGVIAKVQEMERTLALLQKEWPQLFLSPTPPVLLAPVAKNGNGHHAWPPLLQPQARSPLDRVRARDEQLLAFVAQHPDGVKPKTIRLALPGNYSHSAISSVVHRMVKRGQLRCLRAGWFVTADAPATPAPAPRPQRTRTGWTPAMRAAASKRMKARWKDPKAAKHLAASLKKARRERHTS